MNTLICGPYPYKNEVVWGGVEAVLTNLKLGFDLYNPDNLVNVVSGSKNIDTKKIV